MLDAKQSGDKTKYPIADSKCLGCMCFNPGFYQHRGLSGGGSKNSGQSAVCLTNAYRGCPFVPQYSIELEQERKEDGWRIANA